MCLGGGGVYECAYEGGCDSYDKVFEGEDEEKVSEFEDMCCMLEK